MRVLNKYEKEYVKNEVQERLGKLLPSYEDLDKELKNLQRDTVYKDPVVKESIDFLKRYYAESDIEKYTKFNVLYGTDDLMVYFEHEYIKLSVKCDISEVDFKKIRALIDKQSHIRNLKCWDLTPRLNKYFIEFSTWTAPNSDRLKKIDELVNIIINDLIKEVSEL